MFVLRVKDRGRDLAVHRIDGTEEAAELRKVYEQLGYLPDKIHVEQVDNVEQLTDNEREAA
jgi:hypothetical protein